MNFASTGPDQAGLRHYFAVAFALSGLAALLIYGPTLLGAPTGGELWRSLAMFPVMVIGVGVAGVLLNKRTAAPQTWIPLRNRMRITQAPGRWYLLAAVPPAVILAVLIGLDVAVSPVYAPRFSPYGFGFGLLAGFCEELGWTGFAWPRLRRRFRSPVAGGTALGIVWGLWHLPMIDHLGVHPHGPYFPTFAAAFIAALVALRVIIVWAWEHTGSLLIAQLVRASPTMASMPSVRSFTRSPVAPGPSWTA